MAKRPTASETRERAHRIVENTELADIRLLSFSCEQNLQEGERPKHIDNKLDVEIGLSDDLKRIRIICRLTLTAKNDIDSDEKSRFCVQATYRVMYKCAKAERPADEDLVAFGQATGMLNIWPFWREFVHSSTSRMGLPPLTLPLFRFGDMLIPRLPKPRKRKAKRPANRKP